MSSLIASGAVCDHPGCPAPARRTLLIHGQDFYFCAHHSVEVESALAAATQPVISVSSPRDVAPVGVAV